MLALSKMYGRYYSWLEAPFANSVQDKLLQLMADGNQSSSRQLQTQPSLRRLLTAPQSSDNFILSIASVSVIQAAVEPGSPQNG